MYYQALLLVIASHLPLFKAHCANMFKQIYPQKGYETLRFREEKIDKLSV
ncbi:hypothetical protein PTRA_a0874 [Pseudoalteromonas translucida KMM 520]|uniref:Uncharacterized protein n=1 Tax=Pseudoalteromonas translucida KMM 520 TaxID=1315283 RepID=A0A0U2IS67_9GAMM|nr:hypothetical protein PTRA_a0874 [Pseudoalteromonas translucida KMM 520]